MQVVSFLRMCWQLPLLSRVGLETEGKSWSQLWSGMCPAQWPSLPDQGGNLIPVCWSSSSEGWAPANSISFKCVLSISLHQARGLDRRRVLRRGHLVQALSLHLPRRVVCPSCLQCTACAGNRNYFPHSNQMQTYVQASFFPLSQSHHQASATPAFL